MTAGRTGAPDTPGEAVPSGGSDASDAVRFQPAAELLRALASPIRLGIVTELRRGDRCVHELVDALQVAQPLVSQHLRVLRAQRIVAGRRRAREVEYHLTDEHVARIVADAVAHSAEA